MSLEIIEEFAVKKGPNEFADAIQGLVQDRYELTNVPFMSDTIDDAPVTVGQVFVSAEGRIMSSKRLPLEHQVEVWEFVHSFDGPMYYFITVGLMLSLMTFLIGTLIVKRSRSIIDDAIEFSWQLAVEVIDNGELSPRSDFENIIWISWSLFTFLTVQVVFLNLMQTDIMVEIDYPTIERLEQLLDDTRHGNFTHVQPLMIGNLPLRRNFEQSSNTSVFGRIWRKVK